MGDANSVLTAERTLRIWEVADAEIKSIKDEAKTMHEQKVERDAAKVWRTREQRLIVCRHTTARGTP